MKAVALADPILSSKLFSHGQFRLSLGSGFPGGTPLYTATFTKGSPEAQSLGSPRWRTSGVDEQHPFLPKEKGKFLLKTVTLLQRKS